MREQHKVAVERDLIFMGDAAEVRKLADEGGLLTLESTDDYRLNAVSYPYAVAEVKLLIERLGRQYREANGAPLVVTSLVRPTSSQPRNAHDLSVHPAGMAVDLRVPQDAKARRWLESVLLQLENKGVLDVTRERYPPHYHVAVFPAAYAAYVERMGPEEKADPAPVPAFAEASIIQAPVLEASAVVVNAQPDAMLLVVALSALAFTALLAVGRRAPV
jgi:hypothetical protein